MRPVNGKTLIKLKKSNITHWITYENNNILGVINLDSLNLSTQLRLRLESKSQRSGQTFGRWAFSTAQFYKITYNNINDTGYYSLSFDWINYYDDGTVDSLAYGPYSQFDGTWLTYDVDGDSREEYYKTIGSDYNFEGYCGVEYSSDDVTNFLVDGASNGCWDWNGGQWVSDPCNSDGESTYWETTKNLAENFTYPSLECQVTSGSKTIGGGILKRCYINSTLSYIANQSNECNYGDIEEPYLVLNCGIDSDCSSSTYCNKTLLNSINYTCDTPVCSPSCTESEVAVYANHGCMCVLGGGRCDNPNEQYNLTHFCDSNQFLKEIESEIYFNNTLLFSASKFDNEEHDVTVDIQNYLFECQADTDGTCLVPVKISSEYNTSLVIKELEILYHADRIDFTSQFNSYLNDNCVSQTTCQVPLNITSTASGKVNLTNLAIYYDKRAWYPEITDQTNYSDFRVNYIFSGESDYTGTCSLWGNWTDQWEINQTISVTTTIPFNFSNVRLATGKTYKWGLNCTERNNQYSSWGENISFDTRNVGDLKIEWLNPAGNAEHSQNELKMYQIVVNCIGGSCSNVTVLLDPK